MSEFFMTIDGESRPAEANFEVENPATGKAFASAPDCGRGQLDEAVGAAVRAQPKWSRDETARRAALVACADAVAADVERLAEILTREQGKPIAQARYEVGMAAQSFRDNAELPLGSEVLRDDADSRIVLHRKPVGVVAAITPWNFPLSIAARKLAPALLAGNTAILKPSPFTPLATLAFGERLREALPPGVLNVISGLDPLGAWLTDHPGIRKVSFTGSVATGKSILAATVPELKRVTLELGGNDPAIVLSDADPEVIAERLFTSAFNNCGQVCIAVKRVYVEEAVYAPLVSALEAIAGAASVGNGLDPSNRIGPLNNRPQYERVLGFLDSVRADGGRFLCGGEVRDGEGHFLPPTLVAGLEDGSRLVDEEQFGPVLPIIPVANAEDALERANRTHFGLGGSIWTGDWERGAELAARLECGTGWVNQHGALSFDAPFGGVKWSGLGYENGPWGLAAFTELQAVHVNKN